MTLALWPAATCCGRDWWTWEGYTRHVIRDHAESTRARKRMRQGFKHDQAAAIESSAVQRPSEVTE